MLLLQLHFQLFLVWLPSILLQPLLCGVSQSQLLLSPTLFANNFCYSLRIVILFSELANVSVV